MILLANPAAECMFGYESGLLAGASLDELLPERFRGAHIERIARFMAAPSAGRMGGALEVQALRRNGEEFPVQVSLSSLPERRGEGRLAVAFVSDISERVERESAAARLADFWAKTQELAGVGAWEFRRGEQKPFWTDEVFRIHGLPVGDPPDLRTLLSLYAPECRETLARAMERAFGAGTPFHLELTVITGENERRPVRAIAEAYRDVKGVAGVHGTIQDLTEIRRASERERQWAAIVSASSDAMIWLGPQGRIEQWNPAAVTLFGYQERDALGRPFSFLDVVDSAEPGSNLLERAARASVAAEVAARRKDGAKFESVLSLSPLSADSDQLIGYSAVFRDMTARNREQRELERALRSLEDAQRIAKVGCWDWDLVADQGWWSTGVYEIFGLEEGSTSPGLGTSVQWVHPEDQALLQREVADSMRTGRMTVDYRILRASDGELRWLHAEAAVDIDAGGVARRHVGAVQDVTEQRRVEEHLERFFELSRDLMCLVSMEGVYLKVNPAFERVLGYSPQELRSRSFVDVVHPDDRLATLAALRPPERGGETRTFENRCCARDGSVRTLQWYAVRLPDDGLLFAVARDVTLERERERTQLQSQKLEALGVLSGGIAHDFNNILAAIRGFAELGRDDAGDREAVRTHLDEIVRAADRAAELIRGILTFSRRHESRRKAVNVAAAVGEAVHLLRATRPGAVELRATIDPESGCVMGSEAELQQVVLNLVTNAYHAMTHRGGVVELSVGPDPEAEGMMLLAVRDEGPGVPLELADRIFDPFFTTKEVGQGTGLGLSVAHGIVAGLGGELWLDRRGGPGAVFLARLPSGAADAETPARPVAQQVDDRRRTVLVVDDEAAVREVARRMLAKLGCEAETAEGPERALEILSGPKRFDVVLTDYSMPGATAKEFVSRLRARGDETPLVVMTGFGAGALEGVEGLPVLAKPFRTDELAAALRQAADTAHEPC
ncbi:MAG: PAS domain S-box protein [Acidobacteria bacterium]|nr:PAS domain S-box protein [Acidobacteriota bacterium]